MEVYFKKNQPCWNLTLKMIDPKEPVFVVDQNNHPLESKPRDEVHRKNLWHRTCGVWVYNSKGQILCQKRSAKKDIKPGYWEAFFGGHLSSNEDYRDCCVKEVGEELGLDIDPGQIEVYKVLKSDNQSHREWQQIAFLKLDADSGQLAFEKDEVDKLKWLTIQELENILIVEKSEFWVHKPWDGEVLEMLRNRVDSC